MKTLDNNHIADLTQRILDDPSETIPNDLLKQLIDALADAQVYCPVVDDDIAYFQWGPRLFLPVCCSAQECEEMFKDAVPEIFKFQYLKEFIDEEVSGIMINPGSTGFIVNLSLLKLIFNKNRTITPSEMGYDVKVRLNDFRPLTWRDLIIPENMTFMELDDALKTLWDFNGEHLSCFLTPKDHLTIIDKDLSDETMMDCDYDANTTSVSEVFDKYSKITYWYDFGDDWRFDIEIKKKIDYDKDYITIKRYKGKYNPIEDCNGVYGLSEIVYYAEHPDEADSSYFCELVEYLEEFDMEFTQTLLENKGYVESAWHGNLRR